MLIARCGTANMCISCDDDCGGAGFENGGGAVAQPDTNANSK